MSWAWFPMRMPHTISLVRSAVHYLCRSLIVHLASPYINCSGNIVGVYSTSPPYLPVMLPPTEEPALDTLHGVAYVFMDASLTAPSF